MLRNEDAFDAINDGNTKMNPNAPAKATVASFAPAETMLSWQDAAVAQASCQQLAGQPTKGIPILSVWLVAAAE